MTITYLDLIYTGESGMSKWVKQLLMDQITFNHINRG